MENSYVLETEDFFHERLYYAGSHNVENPDKAIHYCLNDGIDMASRLNGGRMHYKVVRVPKKERNKNGQV